MEDEEKRRKEKKIKKKKKKIKKKKLKKKKLEKVKSFVWWMGVKGGLKATTLAGTSQTRKCQMQKKNRKRARVDWSEALP